VYAFHMSDTTARTGGGGGPWVELEHPKPPRVANPYDFWTEAPPERSERCAYWLRQIEHGWRPNKYLAGEGYDAAAHWYGIYIWEYLNLIYPALSVEVRTDG
jgi:hypothetical protein